MKILYIFRGRDSGPSISRVFEPIADTINTMGIEVNKLYLPKAHADVRSINKNVSFLKTHLKREKYDIIHITGDVYYLLFFLRKFKVITTVHDLGFFTNYKLSFYTITRFLFWIFPLRFSNRLTFISEKSKEEALRLLPSICNKLDVVADPYDTAFIFNKKEKPQQHFKILHVGTKPNKNLDRVIEAIRNLDCELHIIGELTDNNISALQNNNILFKNEKNISDEELVKAYKDTDVVSFPSLYEGFGLPIIEAQATGRPVVTSDLEPMRTIAGKGAILVDPHNIESITEGFKEAVNNYESTVCAGLNNVKQYRVERVAESYVCIYNKM